MTEKLASSEVANRLNEWYDLIKQQDINEATRLKSEIGQAIEGMEEDQNVLLYYNLIDSRYKQVIQKFDESRNILNDIKEQGESTETDELLRFYYYFFNGLYEFYRRNYIKAIHYYRQAENYLTDIPDEIEHAEFHTQLANAYYGIDQHFFSLSHAEKALTIYENHSSYTNRQISVKMIIAANRFDLNRQESAMSIYKEAIERAAKHGHSFLEIVGHYNLGLCYEYLNELAAAKGCFETALDIEYSQENKKDTYLEIKYMLARVLFKMDQLEEGKEWFSAAKDLADETSEETYKTKLAILHHIYLEPNGALLDEELETLRKRKLWHDVSDLAANAGRHFKKKEMYKLATKYFVEALQAKEKIPTLQEEAERV
ncbi:aspartate phosphatase [Halalkalibacterium halodurans]|uniref:response regulator aspartate phosphatase n=1 Tax=Halalkalibacterium halodurans TaxID=86665 RepID=UPI002E23DB47|nr:aspartate phosphatase [Halalkalibacterium halodurans]MED4086733.1 aspartate phosphatase [Halalkalibacterium halodurans]MED4107059.1 aspartate phosphatase [Halalkalibacterium halodurans]MED4111003.1 aspartate phosphatase [Halalkalibacterium halodurans]MED4151218.1 aspartate phosphatase [Halalkalibacterium halodurans]